MVSGRRLKGMNMILRRTLCAFVALIVMTVSAWAQADYRIRSGDRLQIEVLEDASLNRTAVVLPNGQFSFPFAGTLRAAGSTIGQVQSRLVTALGPNFANPPTVFVSVVPDDRLPIPAPPEEAPTIRVFFVGEVNSPGVQRMEPGSTALQALAVGGGFTRFAALKRVQLRRTDTTTGRQQVFGINFKAISDGQNVQDFTLLDGDVIVVPQRRLFE